MQSLWDDREAAQYDGDLGLRVYTSRLLGRDPGLVLHGGGNTSVKATRRDITGEEIDVLYIKGSGWDLTTIEPQGFAPVRLQRLIALSGLDELSDDQMAAELRVATLDPAAPSPSVEAILHAILPARFVDHTHADALISLTNTPAGEEHVRDVYGDDALIVPYVMPGFALARLVARMLSGNHGGISGLVLMNHGLVTFGDTARESYERMVEFVDRAERYLGGRGAWWIPSNETRPPAEDRIALSELRLAVSRAAGTPMILRSCLDQQAASFARRPDLASLTQQGPATPDHVIRTKRIPLLGRDVEAYAETYRAYFERHRARLASDPVMLDPAPRVILDTELGLLTAGKSVREAMIAADIYLRTIPIILRSEALGGYRALPESEIFDVEYWSLEQAKLRNARRPGLLQGEVALVTGAASGIGRACVDALRERGAAVIALDVDPAIEAMWPGEEVLGLTCDVTDDAAVDDALGQGVAAYGGLDMLILNAGIFPSGASIAGLDASEWDTVMRVNLDANVSLMRLAHPLLCMAPRGGRVCVIGSKNVPAPGPGAAAYSASKAALTQVARVAALEWGRDGIRVNVLHPNAVFDTGIWTDEILADRAARYGMGVEEYKRNNVLGVTVSSRDVAEVAAAVLGPAFAKTTGAQIPVDGGNERVI
ncbi:MAG TPA: bifunctional aldolase/short-chain dehydrogenase [Chloroflexota bacterium]|nr:bifunctional aldolase/short-chain dehydrogenase [Chloroflexota bacterium]